MKNLSLQSLVLAPFCPYPAAGFVPIYLPAPGGESAAVSRFPVCSPGPRLLFTVRGAADRPAAVTGLDADVLRAEHASREPAGAAPPVGGLCGPPLWRRRGEPAAVARLPGAARPCPRQSAPPYVWRATAPLRLFGAAKPTRCARHPLPRPVVHDALGVANHGQFVSTCACLKCCSACRPPGATHLE